MDPKFKNAARFISLMERMRKLGINERSAGDQPISAAQLALLDQVYVCDGCGIQEIAAALQLTPPTVSVGIRRLEEAGYITRGADPNDSRAVKLSITDAGKRIRENAVDFRSRKLDILLSGLSPTEQDTILRLLDKAISTAESGMMNS